MMPRCIPLRSLVLLTALAALCLADIRHVAAREVWYVLPAKDRRAHDALEKPISVEFVDEPLSSVFESIEWEAKVRIGVNEKRLYELGISLTEPISKELTDMPVRDVLQHVLEPLALDYYIRDGSLIVTTASDPSLVPRLYDVSALLSADRGAEELAGVLRQAASQAPERYRADQPQPDVFAAPFGSFLLVHTSLRGHHEIHRVLELIDSGVND